ncbi:ribonuclease Z [Marinicella meishanensis]|uniref:ribonuclease Z n=1 Tax=Marinicella meishanensis TaxID=2873263 RepID=UPI001CBE3C7A|nr:ribonuclease Z [Marinicella sp. NBU2979]
MEMIFLGTSSGTPTKERNVSALAIKMQQHKAWCLVDCGEGTQHQLLHTPLSLKHLAAICITHVHGDHCFGLPGLLASAAMAGRTEPMTVVAPAPIQTLIQTCQQVSDTHLPYAIEFQAVESLTGPLRLAHFEVTHHALSHRVPSFAYRFAEGQVARQLNVERLLADGIPQGPLWGQVQQGQPIKGPAGESVPAERYLLPARKPRAVVVGGDNDAPELLAAAVAGVDVLIHEATYTQAVAAQVGPGPQHSSAQQVAQFAALVGLPNLILTHFSARYSSDPDASSSIFEIAEEAQAHHQGPLFLAADFDHFLLNQEHELRRLPK